MLVRFWGVWCPAIGGTPNTPKSHQPPPSPAPSRPLLSVPSVPLWSTNQRGASPRPGVAGGPGWRGERQLAAAHSAAAYDAEQRHGGQLQGGGFRDGGDAVDHDAAVRDDTR